LRPQALPSLVVRASFGSQAIRLLSAASRLATLRRGNQIPHVPRDVPRSAAAATPSRGRMRPRSSSPCSSSHSATLRAASRVDSRLNPPLPGGDESKGSPREKRSVSHARSDRARGFAQGR